MFQLFIRLNSLDVQLLSWSVIARMNEWLMLPVDIIGFCYSF